MSEITKICTKCKVEQPFSCFGKKTDAKDGHYPYCKHCKKAYDKQYHEANREAVAIKCKQYNNLNKETIAIKKKIWREENKETLLIKRKIWCNENKEYMSKYLKQYYVDNKIAISINQKQYYEANKEVILKRTKEWGKSYHKVNKDKIKKYSKIYWQSPRGRVVRANWDHKRRTLTEQGDVTTTQLLQLTQTATHCSYCQTDLKETGFHIDHFMPLSKGGRHTISNLVISCPTCNHRKSAKDPFEFLLEISEKYDILAQ